MDGDYMSNRERLLQDINVMPDDLINLFEGFWEIMKKREAEYDEASFAQAIEDSRNGKLYGSFTNGADAIKAMLA
jgi:hypothetical protein